MNIGEDFNKHTVNPRDEPPESSPAVFCGGKFAVPREQAFTLWELKKIKRSCRSKFFTWEVTDSFGGR